MTDIPAAAAPVGRPFARPATQLKPERLLADSGLLGRVGPLEVRLATNEDEIQAAQRLRYDVFYGEMGAVADARTTATHRDEDPYDALCDHLIVIDTEADNQVVATYRLLRQSVAERNGGFYSAGEFHIAPLIERHRDKTFLELGRSCVLKDYRGKRTVELLWQGTWAYILAHNVDVLIGCASLEGTQAEALSLPLSFLHHQAAAPQDWAVTPVAALAAETRLMASSQIDMRRAMRSLPPMIKGYLRLGAHVSHGAVVDHQFGTTDVLIVLPVANINPSYINYYGADASRHAA